MFDYYRFFPCTKLWSLYEHGSQAMQVDFISHGTNQFNFSGAQNDVLFVYSVFNVALLTLLVVIDV